MKFTSFTIRQSRNVFICFDLLPKSARFNLVLCLFSACFKNKTFFDTKLLKNVQTEGKVIIIAEKMEFQ